MTETTDRTEPGNDEQMGEERLAQERGRLDLEHAELIEEDRKTAARPADGDG